MMSMPWATFQGYLRLLLDDQPVPGITDRAIAQDYRDNYGRWLAEQPPPERR